MKKTFYTLRNNSGSEGTYLIDNDYKTLFPGQEITLERPPVNKTANIMLVIFRKEISSNTPLNLKPRQSQKETSQQETSEPEKSVVENKGE